MPTGKHLTQVDKEVIRQTYIILQNKSATARKLNLSLSCVNKILKEQVDSGDLEQARKSTTVAIAGRFQEKARDILDSITPEDIESGRVPTYDKEGKFTGYKFWGPSLMAKTTAAAIMSDKLGVLKQYEDAISADRSNGRLPLPEDIDQLLSGVKGKISQLSVLNIQFDRDHPDTSQRIQQAVEVAEAFVQDVDPVPLDMDNPGVPDGQ